MVSIVTTTTYAYFLRALYPVVIVVVMAVFLFTIIDIYATKETLYFQICKENIYFLSLLQ